jgi:hypothetical protein
MVDVPCRHSQAPVEQIPALPVIGEVERVGGELHGQGPVVDGRVAPGGMQVGTQRGQRSDDVGLTGGQDLPYQGRQSCGRVTRVALADRERVRGIETLAGVGTQGLEQPEAALRGLHDRLVDEPGEQRGDHPAPEALIGARRLHLVEGERAGEDREPREQQRLVVAEQTKGPVHDRAQRPVARGGGAPASGEEVEALAKTRRELAQPERRGAGGAELDRERQPVEPAADVRDHRDVVVRQPLGLHTGRPLDEQPHGGIAAIGAARQRKRRQDVNMLGGQRQPLAAGHEDRELPHGADQPLDDRCERIEKVLGVVEAQDPLVRPQPGRQRADRVRGAGDLGARGVGQRVDEPAGGDRRQVRPPDRAIGHGQPMRRLQREPGLADAAGSHQRHHALVREAGEQQVEVPLAAEQRTRPPRQLAAAGGRR